MNSTELEETLLKHLPEHAVKRCAGLIQEHRVHLKITRSRVSKYGDYRSPYNGYGHRISINHNLNPYTFLVTFLHEMAHLVTYINFSHKVDPHGREWKSTFRDLLGPYINEDIFPEEIKKSLQAYISNPAASSCGDPVLYKALKEYDDRSPYTWLENLPEGCYFKMKGYTNTFIKGKLLRKTFLCKMNNSKREFRISAVAEVVQVSLF